MEDNSRVHVFIAIVLAVISVISLVGISILFYHAMEMSVVCACRDKRKDAGQCIQ